MGAFDGLAFDEDAGSAPSTIDLGSDPFDSLMNKTCSILENQSAKDNYGQRSAQVKNFTPILENVPCRISTDASGRPHEFKTEKKSSLSYLRIFMRPPALPGGAKLTPHHWLKLTGTIDSSGVVTPLGTADQKFYDIFEVENPGGLDHHFEVIVELVIP